MRFTLILTLLLCGTGTVMGQSEPVAHEADVVIYGGTSAAIIAAVQTVKMGHSVVVVSPDKHLGGLSSGGLGSTDSGNKATVGGLSREFYHRIWLAYQPGQADKTKKNWSLAETQWTFEPSVAESIFNDFVRENNITVMADEWLDREKGVKKEKGQIKSLATLSGKVYKGKYFIDATYEGDLLAAAGVSYTIGRESNSQYNETLNGVQTAMAKFHQFFGFVDPYVKPGKPESGLLPGVFEKLQGKDGDADQKVQAYNLRLCLTRNKDNWKKIEKPKNYNELNYELLFRSIEAGQKRFFIISEMPNGKTDMNNKNGFSSDMIGGNYKYPEASYEERAKIYEEHRLWCHGLVWTLANHPRVPENVRNEFSQWGLTKDEFKDNAGWPHQLYVREARRMVGDFVETQRHLQYQDPVDQSVGMGSYQMDSHHVQRYVDYTKFGKPSVRNEGDVQVGLKRPYQIDYRALLPKKGEADNLIVPVCVSSTHIAFGSIRMEPVFMILGQSAATAACLSLDNQTSPHQLDYQMLKKRLEADGQVLSFK